MTFCTSLKSEYTALCVTSMCDGNLCPCPAAGSTNSSLCKYQNPSRVPSYCLRELSRGKFMVCYKDITLLESVGEGNSKNIMTICIPITITI